jgi:hypothetical protein
MKYLNLKLWLPVLLLGIIGMVVFSPPIYYKSVLSVPLGGDVAVVTTPAKMSIDWASLVSQICVGLGSLATIIKGITELIKMVFKRKETQELL